MSFNVKTAALVNSFADETKRNLSFPASNVAILLRVSVTSDDSRVLFFSVNFASYPYQIQNTSRGLNEKFTRVSTCTEQRQELEKYTNNIVFILLEIILLKQYKSPIAYNYVVLFFFCLGKQYFRVKWTLLEANVEGSIVRIYLGHDLVSL